MFYICIRVYSTILTLCNQYTNMLTVLLDNNDLPMCLSINMPAYYMLIVYASVIDASLPIAKSK